MQTDLILCTDVLILQVFAALTLQKNRNGRRNHSFFRKQLSRVPLPPKVFTAQGPTFPRGEKYQLHPPITSWKASCMASEAGSSLLCRCFCLEKLIHPKGIKIDMCGRIPQGYKNHLSLSKPLSYYHKLP